MASELLDIDSLLEPISDDTPTGTDIRENSSPTSPYYTVKDARNAARAAERKNENFANPEDYDPYFREARDHWRTVTDSAPKVLRDDAKDLEITSWYIEALARTHGFAGLRYGFELARRLVETYWDELHPMPDEEDGMSFRTSSLTGLNGAGAEGTLIAPIRNIPLIEDEDFDGPFAYWRYKQAIEIKGIEDPVKRAKRVEETGLDFGKIKDAFTRKNDKDLLATLEDIEGAIEQIKAMGAALDERCEAQHAPPTRNIITALDDCQRAIKFITDGRFDPQEPSEDAEVAAEDGAAGGGERAAPASTPGGPIRSREDAFKQLGQISEFFRKTEPHSPIPFMLERTVQWGRLPFAELIQKLIPDDSARGYFRDLTGVEFSDDE